MPPLLEGCGGCRFQFMDYEEQVKAKERNARQTLEKVGGISWEEVDYEGFIPSPSRGNTEIRWNLILEKKKES